MIEPICPFRCDATKPVPSISAIQAVDQPGDSSRFRSPQRQSRSRHAPWPQAHRSASYLPPKEKWKESLAPSRPTTHPSQRQPRGSGSGLHRSHQSLLALIKAPFVRQFYRRLMPNAHANTGAVTGEPFSIKPSINRSNSESFGSITRGGASSFWTTSSVLSPLPVMLMTIDSSRGIRPCWMSLIAAGERGAAGGLGPDSFGTREQLNGIDDFAVGGAFRPSLWIPSPPDKHNSRRRDSQWRSTWRSCWASAAQ